MENEDNEPFLDAAKNGDIIKLLELINIGAQVTCRDEVGAMVFFFDLYMIKFTFTTKILGEKYCTALCMCRWTPKHRPVST